MVTRSKAKKKSLPNSAPPDEKSGKKSIGPDTRLVLDSNEYILGIPASNASCAELMDQLGDLKVYVPSMVVKEVRRNLQRHYGLGKEFFRLISKSKNITVLWSEPPEELILKYINLGFAEEDAAIAACVEWVGAEHLISENRHFLSRSEQVAFEIVDAETALSLLQV